MTASQTTEQATVKVSDVFVRSWGYDQANITFYEIVSVSKTGKTAKAKRVRNRCVQNDGGPATYVVPATGPERFVTDRCARCSNQHRGEPGWDGHVFTDEYTWQAKTDRVTDDYDHAYRWDGKPEYETGCGWGH